MIEIILFILQFSFAQSYILSLSSYSRGQYSSTPSAALRDLHIPLTNIYQHHYSKEMQATYQLDFKGKIPIDPPNQPPLNPFTPHSPHPPPPSPSTEQFPTTLIHPNLDNTQKNHLHLSIIYLKTIQKPRKYLSPGLDPN